MTSRPFLAGVSVQHPTRCGGTDGAQATQLDAAAILEGIDPMETDGVGRVEESGVRRGG